MTSVANSAELREEETVCLLEDKSLLENQSAKPMVTNLQPPSDWYSEDSPIQASSIDLRIGKVFLPGKTGKVEGSADCPLDLHALEPGQTAIVSTLEELCLPNDIAAIGFPPSHISVTGLLMTNPGHVDPGYAGPMRFTVINMGKLDYVLRRGDSIVTVLFMKLIRPSQKDWLVRRNGKKGAAPKQKDLNLLSPDFLDVGARVTSAAKVEVENAGIKLKSREVMFSLGSAFLSAILVGVVGYIAGVQELKTKVAELEKSLSINQVQQQVADIDRRVKAIEQPGTGAGETPQPKNVNPK
jgi:dCTP deaminase